MKHLTIETSADLDSSPLPPANSHPLGIMLRTGICWLAFGFILLSLFGNTHSPTFSNLYWILDLSSIPPHYRLPFFWVLATCLAIAGLPGIIRMPKKVWWIPRAPLLIAFAWALRDASQAWTLHWHGDIHMGIPVPFSLWVSLCFLLAASLCANRARPKWTTWVLSFSIIPLIAIISLLTLMATLGTTDYRRQADAIVVFGARVWPNGKMSLALQDRMDTAVELYHQGLAPYLIVSGGPVDGVGIDGKKMHETFAMRLYALEHGVPQHAIIQDEHGTNTLATVANTSAWCKTHQFDKVLVVSHFYHTPRITLNYRRKGLTAYAVHSPQTRILHNLGIYMVRETAAITKDWIAPLIPSFQPTPMPLPPAPHNFSPETPANETTNSPDNLPTNNSHCEVLSTADPVENSH